MAEILPQPVQLPEKVPLDFELVRGWIEVEVRDPEGRTVQKGRHEMRSFVNNFLRVFEGLFKSVGLPLGSYGTTNATVVKQDGSSATIYTEYYNSRTSTGGTSGGGTPMGALAADNVDTYGIVVGSGTSPVNLNTYALSSKIAHGTGSGQLDYDAVTVEALGLDTSVSPPVYRIRILRSFKNLSGGSISIAEVGLIARSYWAYYYTTEGVDNDVVYLIARDVLPTTYVVPNGGSATVAIVVEVTLG